MSSDFAVYLKELRRVKGWTVAEAARVSGLSYGRFADLEAGESRSTHRPTGPSRANCERIARAFAVPLAAVLARAGFLPPAAEAADTDEQELLATFRALLPLQRQHALRILKVLAGQS